MKLSIIVPVYNLEKKIDTLYKSIKDLFSDISYEVIFVDNGSTDKTLKVLKSMITSSNDRIIVVSLTKKYSKASSIKAGLKYANGEYTCIYDPTYPVKVKELLTMSNFLDNNIDYDMVTISLHKENKDTFKDKCNNLLLGKINENYTRMFRKNVKDALFKVDMYNNDLFLLMGFNTKYINYKVDSYEDDRCVNKRVLTILKLSSLFSILFIIILLILLIVSIFIKRLLGIYIVLDFILLVNTIDIIFMALFYNSIFIKNKKKDNFYIEKIVLGYDEEIL